MDWEVKRTFLVFDDGIERAGSSATVRSLSASSPSGTSHTSSEAAGSSEAADLRSEWERLGPVCARYNRTGALSSHHVVWCSSSNTSSTSSISNSDVLLRANIRRIAQLPSAVANNGLQTFVGSPNCAGDSDTSGCSEEDNNDDEDKEGETDSRILHANEASASHPSVGSAQHSNKVCKPCQYMKSKVGCQHGTSCEFCHYFHPKRPNTDIPKAQRKLCQRLVQLLHHAQSGSEEKLDTEAQLLQWMSEDSRIGAYTSKALRCYPGGSGSCTYRSDVARLLDAASLARKGQPRKPGVMTKVDSQPPAEVGPETPHRTGDACWTRLSL